MAIDTIINADEQIEIIFDLIATDSEDDQLIYTIEEYPLNGTLSLSGKTVTYISTSDSEISDQFLFTAFDGEYYSNYGTVSLNINGINDPPKGVAQEVLMTSIGIVDIDLIGIDPEGDTLEFTIIEYPIYGSFVIENSAVRYTSEIGLQKDQFSYIVSDGEFTSSQSSVTILLDEENNLLSGEQILESFNYMTPNGDGQNDAFIIAGIKLFPSNTLYIFDVQGVLVFQQMNYGQAGELFDGSSNINAVELPNGTYYYVLDYTDVDGKVSQMNGFIQLLR